MDQAVSEMHRFQDLITEQLGSFLAANSFLLKDTYSDPQGLYVRVIYQSPQVQIGLYKSIPEGEVNVKLARLDASDFESKAWTYLRRLVKQSGLTPVDPCLFVVPQKTESDYTQLHRLSEELKQHYTELLAVVPG